MSDNDQEDIVTADHAELKALGYMLELMRALDEEQRARVMGYLLKRFELDQGDL